MKGSKPPPDRPPLVKIDLERAIADINGKLRYIIILLEEVRNERQFTDRK